MLAVAGGAWSEMQAICMASFTNQNGEQEWFAGILQEVAYPCEEGEDCPTCLTVALQTEDRKTYYLTGLDEHGQESLELSYQQFSHPGSFLVAAIQGIPYTSGSFDYIQVSKIWTRCMHSVVCLDNPHIEVSGTLHPKVVQGKGDGFPDCQTVVLETSEREYYLHWSYLSKDLQILLDTMQSPLQVTIKGEEDCACIIVSDIIENHPITSLCDTWNVLNFYGATLPSDEYSYSTSIFRLTTDTIINERQYIKLLKGSNYCGAMREDNDANIYYIPAKSTHEYLLYAFNAQKGDTLTNLWIPGTNESEMPDGHKGIVTSVSEDSPKVLTVDVEYYLNPDNKEFVDTWPFSWRLGLGMPDGPIGSIAPGIACSCGAMLLCAYKNGEQVYEANTAKYMGCNYNHSPHVLTQISQLCDEWNMVIYPFSDPEEETYYYRQRLITDTVIDGKQYRQLRGGSSQYSIHEGKYLGAIREDFYYVIPQDPHKPKYRKAIFYIPPKATHRYLLYDFNAYVGDTLTNLWVGGSIDDAPNGYTALVASISSDKQRIFTLQIIDADDPYAIGRYVRWIDGVGFDEGGPVGWGCPYFSACDPTPQLLCACKDGKKVYSTTALCKCGSMRLNFLCDTWNILSNSFWDGDNHFTTFTQQLTTDTLINSKRYVRLEQNGGYLGALREDDYARIYYIPAGTTHEYLLYAFNANPGDRFDNVWFGGYSDDFPNGSKATVTAIEQINGRKLFKLDVEYKRQGMDKAEHWDYSWIDGIGLPQGPSGDRCPFNCEGDYGQSVLCAYMDGEQVYASEASQKYGCYYDSNELTADTIKLYRHVNDDPGSSTVDPVDPNQIVVILQQDLLIMHEYMGDEIQYSLQKSLAANAPAKSKLIQADSFRGSASVQLTEDGTYRLDLTNPDWDYSIYGVFDYGTVGLAPVIPDATATKVIRNGHLFIQKGDKIFTFTGVRIE